MSFTQKINTLEQSLAEFKARALNAEVELQEATNSTQRVVELEKQVKEKTASNDKLRHESPCARLLLSFAVTDVLRVVIQL
jgi:predicted RNase H-like nuclease (RuvC/YqgF family)